MVMVELNSLREIRDGLGEIHYGASSWESPSSNNDNRRAATDARTVPLIHRRTYLGFASSTPILSGVVSRKASAIV